MRGGLLPLVSLSPPPLCVRVLSGPRLSGERESMYVEAPICRGMNTFVARKLTFVARMKTFSILLGFRRCEPLAGGVFMEDKNEDKEEKQTQNQMR